MGSGFRTFATSEVLTASNVQNFLMEQSVMSFASTGARDVAITAPEAGMVAFVRSNDSSEGLYHYTSASSWRKGPGWNAPWGIVGTAVATTNQTSIGSTVVDVTSLSVTWTAVANRYYRTTVILPVFSQATTTGIVNLRITDTTPTTKQSVNLTATAGTDVNIGGFVIESNIAAGSATRKARIATTAGSGTITASSTNVATITANRSGSHNCTNGCSDHCSYACANVRNCADDYSDNDCANPCRYPLPAPNCNT